MVFSDFMRFSYIRSLIILCFALQISGCISDENALSGVDESVTSDRNAAAGSNGSNGMGNNTITIVDNTTEVDSSTEVDSTAEVDSTTQVDSNEPSTVTVNWTAPVARTDDTPLSLSEITGYRVYYGQASGDYSNQLDINDSSAIEATLDVTPGLYYFVVTCLDTAGHESVYSEEVMISI
ncbi:MAG: fibronectin type III domain-containing protein [Gammaproteobacteria bacterium]|nr:fibronectin type III domain-containing protein [Gammaproteobacteria bacterium]